MEGIKSRKKRSIAFLIEAVSSDLDAISFYKDTPYNSYNVKFMRRYKEFLVSADKNIMVLVYKLNERDKKIKGLVSYLDKIIKKKGG